MATHSRFVLQFYALTTIVLLFPVCTAQSSGSSTDNSDTVSQSSNGFGYELLRSQLDEMQASISQLQQIAERRNDCAGLENNIATIMNRLETIEKGLKASGPAAPAALANPAAARDIPVLNMDEERLQTITGNIMNARQRNMQNREMFVPRMRNPPVQQIAPRESVYDEVYDSCDDVPSSGVWKIRNGREITNVYCIKF